MLIVHYCFINSLTNTYSFKIIENHLGFAFIEQQVVGQVAILKTSSSGSLLPFLRSRFGAPASCFALLPALRAESLRGEVVALVNDIVGFLAGGNAHDADGIADHAGGVSAP